MLAVTALSVAFLDLAGKAAEFDQPGLERYI